MGNKSRGVRTSCRRCGAVLVCANRGTMEPSYQIAAGKIAHQKIDGEIIVIHFDTGDYYSLTGTGAALWEMMIAPQDLPGIRSRFASWDSRAETSVKRFLDVLVNEGLVNTDAAGGLSSTTG